MEGLTLQLVQKWTVGAKLDSGGFGQVYLASNAATPDAVVKFVPKAPGTGRELLFVDLENVRNVVPIVDSGEHNDFWVLAMPPRREVTSNPPRGVRGTSLARRGPSGYGGHRQRVD